MNGSWMASVGGCSCLSKSILHCSQGLQWFLDTVVPCSPCDSWFSTHPGEFIGLCTVSVQNFRHLWSLGIAEQTALIAGYTPLFCWITKWQRAKQRDNFLGGNHCPNGHGVEIYMGDTVGQQKTFSCGYFASPLCKGVHVFWTIKNDFKNTCFKPLRFCQPSNHWQNSRASWTIPAQIAAGTKSKESHDSHLAHRFIAAPWNTGRLVA